jgi:hypothetical protein
MPRLTTKPNPSSSKSTRAAKFQREGCAMTFLDRGRPRVGTHAGPAERVPTETNVATLAGPARQSGRPSARARAISAQRLSGSSST